MVGGVTGGAGGSFKITVGANTIGGVVSAGIKGDDILLSGGTSAVTSSLGWGAGKSFLKILKFKGNSLNNNFMTNSGWKASTVVLTKPSSSNQLPSYLGNTLESISSEFLLNKLQSILKGEGNDKK